MSQSSISEVQKKKKRASFSRIHDLRLKEILKMNIKNFTVIYNVFTIYILKIFALKNGMLSIHTSVLVFKNNDTIHALQVSCYKNYKYYEEYY